MPTANLAVTIRHLEAYRLRAPIERPVRTSFGTMRERPALLVRVEDDLGYQGWGEIWCNFPAVGAAHRAGLIETVFAPLLVNQRYENPRMAFDSIEAKTAVLAIQAGEPGPFAQCSAGLDIALWDLCARRAGLPLWRLLDGTSSVIRVYASGINPENPGEAALALRDAGHTAFKLKVGFGSQLDQNNLTQMRQALGQSTTIMADANQGWTLNDALAMLDAVDAANLAWLEEPLRADRPAVEWEHLAERSRTTLAAGENLLGRLAFNAAIESRALGVLQPDVAKWGGISAGLEVATAILAAGLRFCPHYLGGGIGLLASAHLLAAVGGDGMLEIDGNPNPLRTQACGALALIADGRADLGNSHGLGFTPDAAFLREFAA